jgi:O-antigen ligase
MVFINFLWLLVWGGMFSGLYNIQTPIFLTNPLAFIQGSRALLPILAAYISIIWIFASKSRFPFFKTPIGLLFYYCLTGIVTSLFLSPDTLTALYWASVYLSPLLVVWIALENTDSLSILRKLIYTNYALFIFVTVCLLPEVYKIFNGKQHFTQFYNLPFNFGQIRSNGVGRFALVVIIISFVRLITQTKKQRFLWLIPIFPSLLLLAQAQSRTALLGLAVSSFLYVYLKGMNWRFLFVGPISAYIIWLSGFKWRLNGDIEELMYLSGRAYTWQKGIEQIKHSPFLGWGFHADRILLQSEHMHNSYLHAMIHAGLIGTIFFIGAIFGIWFLMFRTNLLKRVRSIQGVDQTILMESILILGFLTARSFFESTAAFYGVDLLLLVPSMAYIYLWIQESPAS